MTKKRYNSTEERARKVRELVALHYQPERQDRCKTWVYRTVVRKQFGISERTFFRYLQSDTSKEEQDDKRQLNLF